MTLRTDKDLKSKNFREKKVYILAKDIDSKQKFEIQAKKSSAWWKRPIFWVTLIQAVVSKTLRLFYKIFFCLQNISTLKKSASSHNYEPPPPRHFCFLKYTRPLRVNMFSLLFIKNNIYTKKNVLSNKDHSYLFLVYGYDNISS